MQTLLRRLILSLSLLALALPAAARDTRVIEKSWPAEGVRELRVKGNVGELRVTAAKAEQIVLRLALEPKEYGSFFGKRWGDPSRAELVADISGGIARLEIRTPEDRDGLKEHWRIEVPARLAANLHINVGEIHVSGLAGGIDAKVNVGEMEIEVPSGHIDAEANVGDIRVTTATTSYGDVDLRANVGDTRLNLNNQRVRARGERGPGNRVSLDGSGRDRIRLKVNVGDAQLTIRSTV